MPVINIVNISELQAIASQPTDKYWTLLDFSRTKTAARLAIEGEFAVLYHHATNTRVLVFGIQQCKKLVSAVSSTAAVLVFGSRRRAVTAGFKVALILCEDISP